MNSKIHTTLINAVINFIIVVLMFLTFQVQAAGVLKAQKSNTVIDIGMYADYNRDGKIEPSVDTNTKANPYVFWINDDDDDDDSETRGDYFGYFGNGTDTPGAGTSDSTGIFSKGIDGSRDLIDFMPVYIDIYSYISQLPDDQKYTVKLKHNDSAVNIVYTRMKANNVDAYLNEIDVDRPGVYLCQKKCSSTNESFSLSSIELTRVTQDGVELPKDFIDLILENKLNGIILLEGRENSNANLTLEIIITDKDKNKKTLVKKELPLNLTGAESMYRSFDVRGCTEAGINTGCVNSIDGTTANDEILKSLALPNNITDSKQVFYVHGFNVSEEASRGGSAEVFKRLFQSGSKAQFNSITWAGDEGLPAAYWNNVVNAFNTAIDMKWLIDQLPGTDKTIIAHSLGNMMVSSAIQDHALVVNNYFMLNPAVAIEAYAKNQLQIRRMRNSDWDDFYTLQVGETIQSTNFDNLCSRRLWSSEWYNLFDPNYTCKGTGEVSDFAFTGGADDNRNKITWRNRFGNVVSNTNLVQFYSSGEDVVRAALEGDPGLGQLGTPFNGGVNAWNYQEKSKGTQSLTASLQPGEVQGGWGFRVCDINTDFDEDVPIYCNEVMTPTQAFAQTNDTLRDTPFFYQMNTLLPSTDEEVNELLAYAIPALSLGAGGAVVDTFLLGLKAVDMNTYPGITSNPDWPDERDKDPGPDGVNRLWHHGDYKDVAFLYVFKLYDEMIVRGALK